ncbi:MAG: glycosyltransferase family 4 protein [Candidatus Gastranaerophilales bacterium]|nr:glycosyltransferase family 4 protein [Candidatus Gastranaerophilales bacterium]MCM1073292.1 glycosyltransferase family 4 protein [Bacteroides sp.]
MKILVITDLYPIKEGEKYTPRTIKNFVETWKKLGHEVKVIKPNFLLNSFLRGKKYYPNGVYGDVENINFFFPFWGKMKTSFSPDVVIAHMPSGILYADKLGLPFCAAVHASDLEVLTNPLYKIHFKSRLEKAYRNADRIACRSYVLKQKFLKLYPEFEDKTFVAPSGINGAIKRNWSNNEKIKVLTCGQFIKRKHIDDVILACKKFDNIELTVIGSGKEKLPPYANFTGQLPHDKVLEKMRESDIFILPSENETFGMVYLEAMASGCITVCRKNDGIDGIIKDGVNGFLTENVQETLNRILTYPDKNKILENAYSTILELTEEKTAQNYLSNIINKN